jgi:hypothetical protein
LFRGGANTIEKQHFTLLYDLARTTALTRENIRSAWRKVGLFPFDPDCVLRHIRHPSTGMLTLYIAAAASDPPVGPSVGDLPQAPTTSEALTLIRTKLEQDCALMGTSSAHGVQKLMKDFEKTLAHCALCPLKSRGFLSRTTKRHHACQLDQPLLVVLRS